jgi:hypothetical protein
MWAAEVHEVYPNILYTPSSKISHTWRAVIGSGAQRGDRAGVAESDGGLGHLAGMLSVYYVGREEGRY